MVKKNWNKDWLFTKDAVMPDTGVSCMESGNWEQVSLPHTWNGKDGQDGGNDYYRGTCYYAKKIDGGDVLAEKDLYIEFEGANSSADVFLNGEKVGHHDGGYSTWRVNLTPYLKAENELVVAVDNAPNEYVYPQMADFTFYGGLYRNVNLISANRTRFDLDYMGAPGLQVTPVVTGEDAAVETIAYLTGLKGDETVEFTIMDGEQVVADTVVSEASAADFDKASAMTAKQTISKVHLWNGRKDPHLYTMKAVLKRGEEILDERTTRFGCRSFEIDPEKGFILNGVSYPLRGVSRHQDRPEIGNALLPEHHREDIDLICELGCTTIRLAHYQHDQYFYDLCDEKGLVIWAEIPYISRHMPTGRENTISQMKELVIQNYNHPSIVVWGLSNEITMQGEKDKDLVENHVILNDMVHAMDKTRLTTIAVVSMCSPDSEYIKIPDVVSYNHYYGWYGGDTSMNGPWMDEFHKKHPNIPIGMSEYGCEALNWHTSDPKQGDYTEEYQAYYHEELIKQLYTRPYIWATHVWNMFDFAADARAEGGEDGMNHKGLVTFDRKYKKDAFYAYKAWLSDEPFVHLCGKRYVDRVEDVTKVTVYSNLPEVEMYVNGELLEKQTSDNHFFYFNVPNVGESTLVVRAGECSDEGTIRKVDVFNEDYRMKETGDVLNWFDITMPEGYLSINDTMGDIMSTLRGKMYLGNLMMKLVKMAKKDGEEGEKKGGFNFSDMSKNEGMMKMMSGFTLKRMFSMLGTAGLDIEITKEMLLKINSDLNKIKKKSK